MSNTGIVVSEIFYQREIHFTGGGSCCPPRRAKSDVNISSQLSVQPSLSSTRGSCCTPSKSLLVPPPNTPYTSPRGPSSPMVGPINSTSNSSKMLLNVPQMCCQRSRSSESLFDSGNKSKGNLSNWRISGLDSIIAGNKSVTRCFRN